MSGNGEHPQRRFRWFSLVALVVIFAAFSAVAVGLYDRAQRTNTARVTLCAAQNRSNEALRNVLVLARDSDPDLSAAGARFYQRALALVKNVDCVNLETP